MSQPAPAPRGRPSPWDENPPPADDGPRMVAAWAAREYGRDSARYRRIGAAVRVVLGLQQGPVVLEADDDATMRRLLGVRFDD